MLDDITDDDGRDDNQMTEGPEGSLSRRGLLMTGAALAASGLAPTVMVSSAAAQGATGRKPNVVFILAENVGYGDPWLLRGRRTARCADAEPRPDGARGTAADPVPC